MRMTVHMLVSEVTTRPALDNARVTAVRDPSTTRSMLHLAVTRVKPKATTQSAHQTGTSTITNAPPYASEYRLQITDHFI